VLILPGTYPSARCAPRERGRAIFSRASRRSGVFGTKHWNPTLPPSVEAENQRASCLPRHAQLRFTP